MASCGSTAVTGDDVAGAAVAARVGAFYEEHPYPPPLDDLTGYGRMWDDARRRADAYLFWPDQPYRDDRNILVAGCGTSQAAKYALRWPKAQVTGIDFSQASIDQTAKLKRKHSIHNLELQTLPVERAGELGRSFDHVVCTGVLHHLADPEIGLRALHDVLEPNGAMHLMVYAPYGRTGIYMLQDYCRRLGIGTSAAEIRDLTASLRALPPDHPLTPLLRNSPDFQTEAGIADALLHPQDRAYSVPQLFELLGSAGVLFGRWIRLAAYRPDCGALVQSPHRARLMRLPAEEQYAAIELFRGCMVQHSLVAYRGNHPRTPRITFEGDDWLGYVPIRLPDTVVVEERLPPRAAAVLINRNHSFTDIYLPIDAEEKVIFEAIDGTRSIGEIVPDAATHGVARTLFERLWHYDQVVFDLSACNRQTK
jgi:SAM-dependent methyltransferase